MGADAAATLDSMSQRSSSIAAISSCGVGGHAGLFDRADDGVVVAHQPVPLVQPISACARLTRCAHDDSAFHRSPPRRARTSTRRRRRRRRTCRGLASRAAPHAGATRCRARHRCRQAADEPLHGPQQHLHLHLGARPGVGQIARHPRCREREQQRRGLRVLEVNRLRPKAFVCSVPTQATSASISE